MDDTQQSRVSDAAAAATRKRRSSILKSQRPARTPFSELEFNVATPTDTAKSRRVSFSRRTGVAEFVTNEATTTWKNFYEEHNKTLESSSNDSEANASRQPVGHLGKRIFDQQFEEVEAVDFISGLVNGSLNNVNFSQQLASLECTVDGKLTAPQNKFELSAFTEQSKLFGNDFTAPSIGDNSGRIDVNFSAMQQVEKDDLDEIEKDLERASSKMGCHGPFSNGQNMSEYIEVDLNMTHVVRNDENMSITDTVQSPVQDVSKSASKDNKASLNNDWITDKENIAINPYAAPCETNFAVNEEPDQVLVFDGKRLTLQALPTNIICHAAVISQDVNSTKRRTIVFNESTNNISMTETVPVKLLSSSAALPERRRTVVYEDDTADISITQALPSNILVNENSESNISMTETVPAKLLSSSAALPERRRTVVYEDDTANISITQALPSNILVNENSESNISMTETVPVKLLSSSAALPERRRTVVYEDDTANISITQALPSNILVNENSESNISMTETVPAKLLSSSAALPERRRTVVYEDDTANISITQALPSNILVNENSESNISMTETVPVKLLSSSAALPERRRTVVYEDDTANISITQALPSNILVNENSESNISMTETVPVKLLSSSAALPERRRTVVYEDDTANISITQALPSNIFVNENSETTKKHETVVFDGDEVNIFMTQVLSTNILDEKASKTIAFNDGACNIDEDEANISRTLAISANDYLLYKLDSATNIKKPDDIEEVKAKVIDYDVFEQDYIKPTKDSLQDNRKSTVFEANNLISEKSMTAEIQTIQSLLETEKRRTVIFDNDNCDISMTKPIPAEFITVETEMLNKTETKLNVTLQNQAVHPQLNIIVMQTSLTNSKQPINVEKANDSKVELPIKLSNTKEVKLMTSTDSTDRNIDKVVMGGNDSIIQTGEEERKESLIVASEPSYDSDLEDKSVMAVLESNSSSGDIQIDAADNNSTPGNMFYITKDCEAVVQTDSNVDSDEAKTAKPKDEEDELVHHLEKKLAELKTDVLQNSDLSNDYVRRLSQISNKANDTQNLLDLISNFTDNGDNEDDVKPVTVEVKEQSEVTDHKRSLSVAPSRQSIALSREDLLTNISMAQAALQKSRLALDDSDLADEDTRDTSVYMSKNLSHRTDVSLDMSKNSDRTSYEVVKTLNFDDESVSEISLKDEEKISPLKKTVFGETSYMYETKGKVIPTYLKDVSDGIKELMLDLVKPVSDTMPFQSEMLDRGLLENASTQSTQVQANLTTSSQIDLDYVDELMSITEVDSDRITSSTSVIGDYPEKSKSRVYRNQVKFACLKETEKPEERHSHSHSDAPVTSQPPPCKVLVFDHLNPLNNVLLAPTDVTDVHKYNPRQPYEILCGSRSCFNNVSNGNTYKVETVTTTQFTLMSGQSTKQQENISLYQNGDQFSQNEVQFERTSVDQSVDAISKHLKDDEVNTLIAMRGNKELLQASSSLTLVDDLSDCEDSKTSNNRDHSNHKIKFLTSPLDDVKGQTSEIDNMTALSGIYLQESFENSNLTVNTTKGKKRFYSPSTNKNKCYSPSKEVTPKPNVKMQKISRSPKPPKVPIKVSPRSDSTQNTQINNQKVHQSKNREKNSSKNNSTKSGQSVTVQQLIIDYQNYQTEFEHSNNSEKKLADLNLNPKFESIPVISQSDASFTSSKNLKSMKDDNSTGCQSPHQAPVQDIPSQMDWHPELMGTTSSNLSETDSSVNVVAKIDMLPFMGSHECEWDSKSVADTWSFRLQHGRLRLTTRLAHRHDNATRTRVRGDTRVLDIAVETVQHDRKNPVATLCVRFACETMRYMATHALRTPCYAKEIPQLLRRCAAVTRVALRWGRAMHDAKLQLAYTLDNDGNVSLKVANVRLSSVWEVTMHIELVVDDDRAVPWPKADGLRVTSVVSELDVPDADVRRVLSNMPRDWGHAPRTIWRIFRYLKHKTRDNY